ncbi:MAG: MarR family transcriptional regulator [Betaproteobacteria bacterium]|nr:MarR family transcriptional regulator [Betaproteobacteria bacterium]
MARERYLRTLRSLAECYHAFERYSAAQVRGFGLTPPQFDIVATLGNTPGMSFKELGEKTLITKGTLTGVIDRLELRGLVKRAQSRSDGRSTIVRLTRKGEELFAAIFPPHVAYLRVPFAALDDAELAHFEALAEKLRAAFASAIHDEP